MESLGETPTSQELRRSLEKGDENEKIDTMKKVIIMMANGDPCHDLLMFVIRFVMPVPKNKMIKKLLLIYFELCHKLGPDGKLKQEMILVCNALRNDLQHPNEYVRGSTLRYMTKLKEPELLEPLMPSIRSNLDHRHAYVRRHAVIAVAAIYKGFDHLIPDAPELLYEFLSKEGDVSCLRMAIHSLARISAPLSIAYFKQVVSRIDTMEEPLQQALIDLMKIHGPDAGADKPLYIQAAMLLLETNGLSNLVRYDCATLLIGLTSNLVAVKAVANAMITLIVKESDNNARLVILDRVSELYSSHPHILQNSLTDLLKILSSSDVQVIRKCLSIVVENVTSSNVNETVDHIKRELEKTIDDSSDHVLDYRQLLIAALSKCAISSCSLASSIIPTLVTFMADKSAPYLIDCVLFLKLAANKYPQLRAVIAESLLGILSSLKSSRIFRSSLWIIGEFSEDVPSAMDRVGKLITHIADVESNAAVNEDGKSSPVSATGTSMSKVLADGTYATESAFTASSSAASSSAKKQSALRSVFFESGNIFVPAAISIMLVKLLCRAEQQAQDKSVLNEMRAKAMLILINMIKMIVNSHVKDKLNQDSFERISLCLRMLAAFKANEEKSLFSCSQEVFSKLMVTKKLAQEKQVGTKEKPVVAVDEPLQFGLLKQDAADRLSENVFDRELKAIQGDDETLALSSKLDQVFQLTGFSDPLFAEAYVDIQDLDVVLDVIIVNQTGETIQNLCLEFISTGTNRTLYRPPKPTLGPYSFMNIKANIKILSADQGIIQGCISFDPSPSFPLNYIILNSISLDVLHFLQGSDCPDSEFATLWRILEWENKIHIKTRHSEFATVIRELTRFTNFKCLTPNESDMRSSDECEVFSANLFAHSKFNEEVLANVSLEKMDGKVSGHIRIRSKSNGLAYILGNKISQHMGVTGSAV